MTPPPCAQPPASLDTVYHRVVEESRLKRKAEKQGEPRPLQALVEACARQDQRQHGCNLCAFKGFVPTLQGMLEDLKDEVVRLESGMEIAARLLENPEEGCVCPPSGDGQQSAKRRALGSPFRPRKVAEQIDPSDSDDDVPIRRRNRPSFR